MNEKRFYTLLLALALLLFATPLLHIFTPSESPALSRIGIAVLYVIVLLSALYAVARTKVLAIIVITLLVPVLALEATHVVTENRTALLVSYLLSIVFLGLVIGFILRFLFTTDIVTGNIICAAICVYLLFGLLSALVFSSIEIVQPGSFGTPPGSEDAIIRFEAEHSTDALYFSFVTLTTLGYGDITPQLPAAKMLVAFEAVFGQLFLAVLVARLVGMHIAYVSILRKQKQEL